VDESDAVPLLPPPISKDKIGGGVKAVDGRLVLGRRTADIRYNKGKLTDDGYRRMKMLTWERDESTAYWARRCPLPIRSASPVGQYDGSGQHLWEETWRKHILAERFPAYCRYPGIPGSLLASPRNIIACLKEERYLEGLALTVAWGSMARTKKHIYTEPLESMEKLLRSAAQCIDQAEMHGTSNLISEASEKPFLYTPLPPIRYTHHAQ